MAASSYSKFIIKLEEMTVNSNVRRLYGASMRYVRRRKSDFQRHSHALGNNVTTHSSTDNLLSPILVSNMLRKFDTSSKKNLLKNKKIPRNYM